MRIRMYNVGHGDCFCLREKKKNLLVDFGTANSRIQGRPRRDAFDVVLSDLMSIENKNLLLTHFSLDHLSGLLYVLKHRRGSFDFKTLYLPDVFTGKEMNQTLVLLLLEDLRKDAALPSHQVSLWALTEAICTRAVNTEIVLLERGSIFENKYIALWPDRKEVEKRSADDFAGLYEKHPYILDLLLEYADKLRMMILSKTEKGREKPYSVSALEQEFRSIRVLPEFAALMNTLDSMEHTENNIRHRISLVFQNEVDGDENLLFTGDIETEDMGLIAANYDEQIPLHENYWCIKVPHHGTASHYFNFAEFEPENLLISNGIYHTRGKKQAKAARTAAQYCGMFHSWDVTMWCSNAECCDGWKDGCTCKESEIIEPRYYIDIR